MEDQTYTDEYTEMNDYDTAQPCTQSVRLESMVGTADSADAITELLAAAGTTINKK